MKYRFYSFLSLFFLVIVSFAVPNEIVHVMRQGDTIYSIAKSYGLSAQELLQYNKISDAKTVQIGQRIRIPSQIPQARSYEEYTVQKGDNIYRLALRYNISQEELLDLNGFAPNYVIKIGERIRVPALNQTGLSTQIAANTQNTAQQSTSSGTAVTKPPETAPKPVAPAPKTQAPSTNTPAKLDPSIVWPVKAKSVSYLSGGLYGVQVMGERREPVKSLTKGTVVSTGPFRGFGNVAIVQKPDGYLYVYGGCETISVKEGDKVMPGTELGKLGIDAKSSQPQLFLLVYQGKTPIDPAKAPRA